MAVTLRCIFAFFLISFGTAFFAFSFDLVLDWQRMSIQDRFLFMSASCFSGMSFFLLLAVGAWLHSTAIL